MNRVTFRLPDNHLEDIENLVGDGVYPDRSEALREGVRELLKKHDQHSRRIADGGQVQVDQSFDREDLIRELTITHHVEEEGWIPADEIAERVQGDSEVVASVLENCSDDGKVEKQHHPQEPTILWRPIPYREDALDWVTPDPREWLDSDPEEILTRCSRTLDEFLQIVEDKDTVLGVHKQAASTTLSATREMLKDLGLCDESGSLLEEETLQVRIVALREMFVDE